MSDKTIRLYCSSNLTNIQHLANHLENERIEYQIIGDTSTTVLGGYNPTQKQCLVVFRNDYEQAKAVIQPFLDEEE